MQMFLLMLVILISAIAISYLKEIWIYLCLVLGSLLKDIQSIVEKLIKKGR